MKIVLKKKAPAAMAYSQAMEENGLVFTSRDPYQSGRWKSGDGGYCGTGRTGDEKSGRSFEGGRLYIRTR